MSPSYDGNTQSIPSSLKEIKQLSTAYLKEILNYHGLSINGNRDELTLRITLMKDGHYNLAFYKEEEEILKTIDDAEKLILEERQDYLTNPKSVFRTRTHGGANKYVKDTPISHIQFDLKNLHKMLEKQREYITIQRQQNREKGKTFIKSDNRQDMDSMQIHTTATAAADEAIFSIGAKVKVKWSRDDVQGTDWKPGWYTAYVQSADPLQDQITVEHCAEPGCLYVLDVTPMLADGSLKLQL